MRHYHADNGIFKSKAWMNECRKQGQGLTFAGVNAHHTNGLAERRIRSLQDLTRTMLIHVSRKWRIPTAANLWPFALKMANDTLNNTPNLKDVNRRSPLQTFSGSTVNPNPKHWAPFGCPAYVVDRRLQEGKKINKWAYKSEVGIYVGRSPSYGRNVALILNRHTGLVSPQFHLKLDSTFTAIDPHLEHPWLVKAGFVAKKAGMKQTIKPGPTKRATPNPHRDGTSKKRTRLSAPRPPDETVEAAPDANIYLDASNNQSNEPPDDGAETKQQAKPQAGKKVSDDVGPAPAQAAEGKTNNKVDPAEPPSKEAADAQPPREIFGYQTIFEEVPEIEREDPLHIYKASADPDTLYHHEAMKQKDASEFRKAMSKEWVDQLKNGNFTIMLKSNLPEGAVVLPAVWQMRRKRDISTGLVKKYKARLNLDGSRIVRGRDYNLTYSPVVRWFSIRLLLALTIINGWHTQQVDYVQAYPQAPIEKEVYMEIPKGMEIKGKDKNKYALKIHKNIYGQKQAGRVWHKFLTDKLINEVGFKRSRVDECVFYRGGVMYILYTDDSILAGANRAEVQKAIEDIKKAGLKITVEGDISDFLGVKLQREQDGTIEMKQPYLINQILEDMHMNERTKGKQIPAASSKILKRHLSSPQFDNSFAYRSIVGKLNYLEKGSRPDISYATHQLARFTTDPREEHGQAARWLARYLKRTKEKGLIMKPDPGKGLEVHVDADFAGNYDYFDTSNSDTAKSRHGYLISYSGIPITWKSQLQTEIALSTTEAEYTGLSYSLREAIPIVNLLKELKENKFKVSDEVTKIHCKVFEDNAGAIEIAKEDKYRPRTKHLNCRLHHFRSYVDSGEVSIHKIDTFDQPADLLTKPLNEVDFERHRLSMMGW